MKIDSQLLIQGERRTLSKAITLIESSLPADQLEAQILLESILPHTGKSFRLGITGVPGVGKSTFIENFGLYLLKKGHKVAVLAVDPSSPLSGGSILGDKTRMEKLSQENSAFIRPSPTLGFLGGVGEKTRENILLCEAAGFDFIIVETVGVGQSEFEVADMVDFFLVLMLPNAGDELQGIKKGILELADSLIINKADGQNISQATQARAQYESALHIIANNSSWRPQTLTCSGLLGTNLDQVYNLFQDYKKHSNLIQEKRLGQNKNWFSKLIQKKLETFLNNHAVLNEYKASFEQQVITNQTLPSIAAENYFKIVRKIINE